MKYEARGQGAFSDLLCWTRTRCYQSAVFENCETKVEADNSEACGPFSMHPLGLEAHSRKVFGNERVVHIGT